MNPEIPSSRDFKHLSVNSIESFNLMSRYLFFINPIRMIINDTICFAIKNIHEKSHGSKPVIEQQSKYSRKNNDPYFRLAKMKSKCRYCHECWIHSWLTHIWTNVRYSFIPRQGEEIDIRHIIKDI